MLNLSEEQLATLKPILERERPLHLKGIRSLFRSLDTKFNLYGADLPVTLTYDTDIRGSYLPTTNSAIESFSFSLFFIGYALKKPLSKEERNELFKIEYAYYMAAHLPIPDEHKNTETDNNRAWQYCYSLITSPNTKPVKTTLTPSENETASIASAQTNLQLLRELKRAKENRTVKFNIGDNISHPKYGNGIIEHMEPTENSVRLTLRFGDELRVIDQEWIIKNMVTIHNLIRKPATS